MHILECSTIGQREYVTPESVAVMSRVAHGPASGNNRGLIKRWMGCLYDALLLIIWEELSLRIQH